MSVSRFTTSSLQNGFIKYNDIWDGISAVGSMEAISSATLSAASASFNFNLIPQTYQHLQIRGVVLGSSSNQDILMRAGASGSLDSATNYSWHELRGNGTVAGGTGVGINQTFMYVSSNAIDTTYPEVFIIDLLDYSNTNKFKTIRSLRGGDRNGSGTLSLFSGNWRSTSAISNLSIYVPGGTFNANSIVSLYGVK